MAASQSSHDISFSIVLVLAPGQSSSKAGASIASMSVCFKESR